MNPSLPRHARFRRELGAAALGLTIAASLQTHIEVHAQPTTPIIAAPVPLDNLRCGHLGNAYGPFDYRTDRDKLGIVERAHFTPAIESLIKVEGSSSTVAGDLDYTLRAFPNHHRALNSVLKLADRSKVKKLGYMNWEFECYPLRAISFRPDDPIPRMIFALYLNRNGRTAEALEQARATVPLASDSPFTHYSLGLLFLECRDFENALKHAHLAQELGMTRGDLREALQKAGKWREPVAAPVAAASQVATPAAGASAASGASQ